MHTLRPKHGAPPPGTLPLATYWDVELERWVEPTDPEWSWETFDFLSDGEFVSLPSEPPP